jgi:hypothetical protein
MRTLRILLGFLVLAIPAALFGQFGVSIAIGPPALPVYEQPICPAEGYLWTPGYWAYNEDVADYYWVPGTWVMAPEVGFLWTPGFWGWGDGGYRFNQGYWGEHVGFYGGINYGYGYFGDGFSGGRWDHDHFFYNRSVSHIDITINRNVYDEKIEHRDADRISFNGGKGGVEAHATPEQEAAGRERHIAAVPAQDEHLRAARNRPELRASSNHGNPPVTATSKPGDFSEHGGTAGKEGAEPVKAQSGDSPRAGVHPKDLPPIVHPEPIDSGDKKADRKYQQQQDKLIEKQTQERQSLQAKQDAEHQQKPNPASNDKLEQKHQKQTQQMVERHDAQQKEMVSRQPQPKPHK